MIGLITGTDLNQWAARVTTPPEFPRFIRLLVYATVRTLRKLTSLVTRQSGWVGGMEG
jgi:hypothetical protein